MPAQVERVDDVQGTKIVGLAPHHLLPPEAERERRQHQIDEGFAEFVLEFAVELFVLAERFAVRLTDVVDRIVHPTADQGERGLFERTGRKAVEGPAVAQKIILALELRGIALHDELGIPEHGRAQDVLRLEEPFEFDVIGHRHDGRGAQRRQAETQQQAGRGQRTSKRHGAAASGAHQRRPLTMLRTE